MSSHKHDNFTDFVDGCRSMTERELVAARPKLFHAFARSLQNGTSSEQTSAARCCWWLCEQGFAAPETFCYRLLDIASLASLEHKEIGYQALNQCVPSNHEGLFLATNIVQKGLGSAEPEAALIFLANARAPLIQMSGTWESIRALLTHTRPGVRKKAIAALSACLRLGCIQVEEVLDKLRECLDDEHQGVVNATLGLLCTLDPSECLILVPRCAGLLDKTSNVMLQSRLITFMRKAATAENRIGLRMETKLKELVGGDHMKVVQLGAALALTKLVPPLKDTFVPVAELIDRWIQMPDHNLKCCALRLATAVLRSGLSMSDCSELMPNLKCRVRRYFISLVIVSQVTLLIDEGVPALTSEALILLIASLSLADVSSLVSLTTASTFHGAAKWNGILLCQAIQCVPVE